MHLISTAPIALLTLGATALTLHHDGTNALPYSFDYLPTTNASSIIIHPSDVVDVAWSHKNQTDLSGIGALQLHLFCWADNTTQLFPNRTSTPPPAKSIVH